MAESLWRLVTSAVIGCMIIAAGIAAALGIDAYRSGDRGLFYICLAVIFALGVMIGALVRKTVNELREQREIEADHKRTQQQWAERNDERRAAREREAEQAEAVERRKRALRWGPEDDPNWAGWSQGEVQRHKDENDEGEQGAQ